VKNDGNVILLEIHSVNSKKLNSYWVWPYFYVPLTAFLAAGMKMDRLSVQESIYSRWVHKRYCNGLKALEIQWTLETSAH
jgi:hypothetical protein